MCTKVGSAPQWNLAPVYHRWWRGLDILHIQEVGNCTEAGRQQLVRRGDLGLVSIRGSQYPRVNARGIEEGRVRV
jgi:hypothetical protein